MQGKNKSALEALVSALSSNPLAGTIFSELAETLIPDPIASQKGHKEINDPIWKIIRLSPLELSILDTPLMQRLRNIRQLGLAYLVYPGATHSRLEHSIGVMHAAKRMLSSLTETMKSQLSHAEFECAQQLVGVAGLLHDCGHVAFSHLGENILGDVLESHISEIKRLFATAFSLVVTNGVGDGSEITINPRPAELISALFVISPSMTRLLARQGGIVRPVEEFAFTVAALILGCPVNVSFGHKRLLFLKDIITGDLDADKIDYVARDGYFAGVPLAVDVERLLSQIIAIDLKDQPSLASSLVYKPAIADENIYALGLRPTGASSMEMLVLTRVYLFDRIYLHHKVKAAERFAENILRSYISQCAMDVALRTNAAGDEQDTSLEKRTDSFYNSKEFPSLALKILMPHGGDDALLASILLLQSHSEPGPKSIGADALKLMYRRLPVRALPLALRACGREGQENGDRVSKTYWPRLKLAFNKIENRERFEDRIIELTETDGGLVFDYSHRKPIPEDPDIWVRTSPDAPPERLNKHFSVEQLSNAYQELKSTSWIFASLDKKARVAASAAVALYEQFGIITSPHGLELAKIPLAEYDKELTGFESRRVVDRSILDALRSRVAGKTLVVQPFEILECLPVQWSSEERNDVARSIAESLSTIGLPSSTGRELGAVLPILRLLLAHARSNHEKFSKWPRDSSNKEATFADDLKAYLEQSGFEKDFKILREVRNQPGRIDILCVQRQTEDLQVVVELKSEDSSFSKMVQEHAGQAMAYTTHEYARISILYVQFGGVSHRLADAIAVQQIKSAEELLVRGPNSKLATICIGHRAFGVIPSQSGKQSEPG